MKIPAIRGVIDRRILVNYRVEADIMASLLPSPFRPKTIHGVGMAGICLIRLKNVRPTFSPLWLGAHSENAAHRAAVEWDHQGLTRQGVYIFRRDTSSRLNALAGGRLFPGSHHHACFTVDESGDKLALDLASDDDFTRVAIRGRQSEAWPQDSVFDSLEQASAFFEAGSVGFSATKNPECFQGVELECENWHATSLDVERAESSFFDDTRLFPKGSIEFDCALLMRGIEHEWHGVPDLCCADAQAASLGQPRCVIVDNQPAATELAHNE
ncbi:MAG TPA: DUF2071 domain-containing protein [Lacipirellulaceae bacterium]|nr:DUF2071 domain-containing protein [Lacipirellulaceae bacterium]